MNSIQPFVIIVLVGFLISLNYQSLGQGVYSYMIDVQTGKVNGSFDVDSILVRISGEWLWDDIPVVY